MAQPARDMPDADLSAYLDRELSPERTREIEQLLRESEDARRLLNDLRDVSDRLAALPRHRAPDELTAAMARHAERRLLLAAAGPARRLRRLRHGARIVAAAAVVALGVLVGWRALRPGASVPPPGPGPAAPPSMLLSRAAESETRTEKAEVAARDAPSDAMAGGAVHADASPPAARGPVPEPAAGSADSAVSGAVGNHLALSSALHDDYDAWVAYSSASSPLSCRIVAGSSLSEAPVVIVTVSPRSSVEYLTAAALLDRWGRERATDGAACYMAAPGGKSIDVLDAAASAQRGAPYHPVELLYEFPVDELSGRISELNRSAPEQVWVHMSFQASDAAVVAAAVDAAQAVAPLAASVVPEAERRVLEAPGGERGPPAAGALGRVGRPAGAVDGRAQRPEGAPAAPRAAGVAGADRDERGRSQELAAAPPATSPPAVERRAAPARPGAAGPARAGDAAGAPGGSPGGGRPAERPASVGAGQAVAPADGADKSAAPRADAARERGDAAGQPPLERLAAQLLGLMLKGAMSGPLPPRPEALPDAASQPAGRKVTFRVRLYPPPDLATAGEADAGAGQETGVAGDAPPAAEPAATRPAGEQVER